MADDAVQQILAAIQNGPSGGAAATRNPLGVPAGYSVGGSPPDPGLPPSIAGGGVLGGIANALTARPAVPPIQPRYVQGDEMKPAALPAEKIAALQSALVRAGLIGPKDKFRVGVWDATSAAAYKRALETANAAGIDDQTAIAQYANAPEVSAPDAVQPLVKKLPNPINLRATIDTVVKNTVGHGVDPMLTDRIMRAYQAEVGRDQQQEYDVNNSPTGGTSTDMPTAANFAEQQIRRAAPKEVALNDSLHAANLVMQLFSGGAGG